MADRAPSRDPRRTQRVRLEDGRTLWLRPVAPADAAPIAGGFAVLREDDVRRRFLHPVKALGEDHLQRLTQPGDDAFVVVAAEPLPPGEALVGAVARYARDADDPRRAEFAILVAHPLAGQGLGRRLLRRLFEAARADGIRTLWGDVLDENAAMLRLAERVGFKREPRHLVPGQTRVVKTLRR
jgi:RimJ/RimL family protein N-acetyltransferase